MAHHDAGGKAFAVDMAMDEAGWLMGGRVADRGLQTRGTSSTLTLTEGGGLDQSPVDPAPYGIANHVV